MSGGYFVVCRRECELAQRVGSALERAGEEWDVGEGCDEVAGDEGEKLRGEVIQDRHGDPRDKDRRWGLRKGTCS